MVTAPPRPPDPPKPAPLPRPTPSILRLQRRIVAAQQRDARRLTSLFQAELIAAFERLGRRAQRAFRNLAPRPVRQADPSDTDLVNLLTQEMRIEDWLVDDLEPRYRTAYLRTAQTTTGTIGATMGLAVGLPDHLARRIVAEGGRRLGLVDVRGQSRTALFHALSEGRAQGLAREALGAHIKDRIQRGPWRTVQTRALVIARTETAHAQRISALRTYERMDTVQGVRAFDAQVGATDADCEERNGRVYSTSDADIETSLEHPNGTLNWAPHIQRGPRAQPQRGRVNAPSGNPLATQRRTEEQLTRKADDLAELSARAETAIDDTALKEFAEFRWGRQEVQLVDGAAFDAAEGRVIWRGISREQHVQANLNGEWFGRGWFGNGNYYGRAPEVAQYTAPEGWAIRGKLDPRARTIDSDSLTPLVDAERARGSRFGVRFVEDEGRWAARNGYDAIIVEGDHVVLLNQRAMLIDKRSLPQGEWGQRFKALPEPNLDEVLELTRLRGEVARLEELTFSDLSAFDALEAAQARLSALESRRTAGNFTRFYTELIEELGDV